MPWKQLGDNVFSRPLGENETFMKLLGDPGHSLQREHWALNFTAKIQPTGNFDNDGVFAARLRRAWAHLRFLYPSLAAEPEGNNVWYTVPSSKTELEDWVDKSFAVLSDAVSADEVMSTLKPTPYAQLYFLPKSREILGHTAHWRSDGVGSMILLDALLELLAQPDLPQDPWIAFPWGREITSLPPSVEEAAGVPVKPSSTQSAQAKKAFETFGLAAGAIGIPYLGDSTTIPTGTRCACTEFSPQTTEAVVKAVRSRNISVTAAVHASVAAANIHFANSSQRSKHYTSTVRFTLRPYMPPPYNGPEYAAMLLTTGWMAQVATTDDWETHARKYRQEYRTSISPDYLAGHREYAQRLCNLLQNLPETVDNPPSDVDISSIGVLEKWIRHEYGSSGSLIQVQAISVGLEVLTRQAICFVWTFRDRLNLRVVYNESFHAPEQMQAFAETVKNNLLEGLGIAEVD
ncbi:hypothetical protein ANI_1_3154014 [Paecilomyces variotii No. 5]|uniref:Condensation domain-containing protein n=1 Tax=Byssochlamys spectabilis (strain No. 5 / NBRC 109023) TaxID=1356009 RepID=V5FVG4_BYSSN|nr:hypothetical protein ANI_1_3154014 [Paecilomyces variotii No. 5]